MPETGCTDRKQTDHTGKKIKFEVREKTDELTATRNWDASIDRKLADHNKRIGSSRMLPVNKMSQIV
jgi:hypothetical protein